MTPWSPPFDRRPFAERWSTWALSIDRTILRTIATLSTPDQRFVPEHLRAFLLAWTRRRRALTLLWLADRAIVLSIDPNRWITAWEDAGSPTVADDDPRWQVLTRTLHDREAHDLKT